MQCLTTGAFLFFEAGDAKHLGDGQEHERRVQTVQSQHKAPNASVWENTRSVVSKRSLDKKDCRSKNHERLVYIM